MAIITIIHDFMLANVSHDQLMTNEFMTSMEKNNEIHIIPFQVRIYIL